MKKKRKPIETAGFVAAGVICLVAVVLCLSDVTKTGFELVPKLVKEEREKLPPSPGELDYQGLKEEIQKNLAEEAAHDPELAKVLSENSEAEPSSENNALTVTGVIDAVTYETTIGKVRLIGVSDIYGSLEDGTSAKDAVSERFRDDAELTIVYGEEQTNTKSQTLIYAYFSDGTMVQDWLLENGYVKAYSDKKNTEYDEQFSNEEQKAKNARSGIWHDLK